MKKALFIGGMLIFAFGIVSVTTAGTGSSIVSPAEGEFVLDTLYLEAMYEDMDVNPDPVYWAVRYDTCAAATSTVLGNVDGHSDPYTWDYTHFIATADVSGWTPGLYCFIFNPSEDAGATDVRLTQWFYVVEGYVHGGGHMIEETDGKRKDWNDVSFGGGVADLGANGYVGDWQISFHNVGYDDIDKGNFHANEVTDMNFFTGTTCTAANFTATGEWNGMPGYWIVFRAGDSGSPNTADTTRVTVSGLGGVVYDTHWVGEFPDESDCVGTARTGLDNGNITVAH